MDNLPLSARGDTIQLPHKVATRPSRHGNGVRLGLFGDAIYIYLIEKDWSYKSGFEDETLLLSRAGEILLRLT